MSPEKQGICRTILEEERRQLAANRAMLASLPISQAERRDARDELLVRVCAWVSKCLWIADISPQEFGTFRYETLRPA